MRRIGSTKTSLPSTLPDADGLRTAAVHQAAGLALAAVATTGINKGVYRFATHEDMNRHSDDALARAIALNAHRRTAHR